uniref:Uncharacterized protein n=1 Tax=Meloidogyne enterolobii TaxID=390850 RepID=A0A6V7WM28_MELEN|nr:unnamed protein product [Meloidogyne enterolobii]
MPNKQSPESTNKSVIEMSPSSTPPAELRTTKALPQVNDSNEFIEDDRIIAHPFLDEPNKIIQNLKKNILSKTKGKNNLENRASNERIFKAKNELFASENLKVNM